MQLLVLRRVMVSARARGMPEITNHGKLFFFDKNHWQPVGYRGRGFGAQGNDAFQGISIVREVIGARSGRRTEHLVAVDVNPVSMSGHGFFFVRCHDCSAPRRQT